MICILKLQLDLFNTGKSDSYREYVCRSNRRAASTSDSYKKYVCRSNKYTESTSWFRSGRAAKRKKMYTVDEVIVEKSITNYRKVASYYNKASMEDI